MAERREYYVRFRGETHVVEVTAERWGHVHPVALRQECEERWGCAGTVRKQPGLRDRWQFVPSRRR